MVNLDFPHPDPDWDYYDIWQAATAANRNMQKLITVLSDAEESSPETDTQVRALLSELQLQLSLATVNFTEGKRF